MLYYLQTLRLLLRYIQSYYQKYSKMLMLCVSLSFKRIEGRAEHLAHCGHGETSRDGVMA